MRMLAERYGHDASALDMVFWHILTRLSYYRELHMKAQLLLEVGVGPTMCRVLRV
jgi:hypothetical protein